MKRALALVAILLSATLSHAQTVVLFTTPGTATWTVPAGVTTVVVECVGGGGSGGEAGALISGVGGGGGAYAKSALAVKPGQVLTYTVGAGGGFVQPGWASAVSTLGQVGPFNATQGVKAEGGKAGGRGNDDGTGGATSNCIGTFTITGANGGKGVFGMPVPCSGGGGGGGFNPASVSQIGAIGGAQGGFNVAGGTGGPGGGTGASFVPAAAIGTDGSNGAGGGGAAGNIGFPAWIRGGNGGNGWVKITY